MPRTARVVLPGYPHHVIQRGHNRAPVFVHERDYRFFLQTLKEWKTRLGCRVYAYCLMTNHVHMVIDPGEEALNLGLLGATQAERRARYRDWVQASIPDDEWELIRAAAQRGQLTGGSRFQRLIEERVGRRIELRGRGRPGHTWGQT